MNQNNPLLRVLFSMFMMSAGSAHASPESDFWKWFGHNETALFDFERDQERTFDRLAAEMQKIHPDLTFEFGPKQNNQREFVISADGIREAFPKVESLFASAPSMPNWKFIKFRPRRPPFDLRFEGISVKANSISVSIQVDGAKAGLTVFIPGYSKATHKAYAGIAFLFLDQALGEFDVETRVGFIDVVAPAETAKTSVTLAQLPLAFDTFFK